MLPVASTRSCRFPESYSARWIDTVSAATGVAVRVAAGATFVGVGPVSVEVGGTFDAVGAGCVAVGIGVKGNAVAVGRGDVGVRVGVGAAACAITNERTVDHAPLVPLAVRPRTRHQYVRWLVKV